MYKMQFAWMRRIFLLKIKCSHRGSSTWSCYDIPAFIMHQQWKSSKSTFWNHIEWYKWNCILKSDRFFIEWCRAWSLAWRQPMQRQPMGQNRAVTFWKCVAPPPKYCYSAYIVTCIDICIILYINTLWCIMYNLDTRCFPYSSEYRGSGMYTKMLTLQNTLTSFTTVFQFIRLNYFIRILYEEWCLT